MHTLLYLGTSNWLETFSPVGCPFSETMYHYYIKTTATTRFLLVNIETARYVIFFTSLET